MRHSLATCVHASENTQNMRKNVLCKYDSNSVNMFQHIHNRYDTFYTYGMEAPDKDIFPLHVLTPLILKPYIVSWYYHTRHSIFYANSIRGMLRFFYENELIKVLEKIFFSFHSLLSLFGNNRT